MCIRDRAGGHGEGDVADDQGVHPQVGEPEQPQNQHQVDGQGDGGVLDRGAHKAQPLQDGAGDGGEDVEDRGRGTHLQQAHRQVPVGDQAGEEQGDDRPGQHRQPHRTGQDDDRVELDHRVGLAADLAVVPQGLGGDDAGDDRGRHGRGDGHRHVDEQYVLGVEDPLQRADGGGGHPLGLHDVAENQVVGGVPQLVDRLAEDHREDGQQQDAKDLAAALLHLGAVTADLAHDGGPVEGVDDDQQQQGGGGAGQGAHRAPRRPARSGLREAGAGGDKGVGRPHAHHRVDDLLKDLREGGGHHGAPPLEEAAQGAHHRHDEGGDRQHPQGGGQPVPGVEVFQPAGAEVEDQGDGGAGGQSDVYKRQH